MRRALRDFSDEVRDSDIALIFYAGHGIEVNGTNYLIPVDAALERDIDVEDETISLDRVLQMLEHAKRLRLVILDACRDNPFVRSHEANRQRLAPSGAASQEWRSCLPTLSLLLLPRQDRRRRMGMRPTVPTRLRWLST